MSSPLANRNILVTGGTGSFGSAFVRRALGAGARRVVIFSRDELKQSELRAELDDDERLRWVIGSVTDRDVVLRAMRGVDFVVHAAAMKQIDTCERNPWEATATNTYGTQTVASCAIEAGAERAIFLSTDKAAAPNTHYGATKLAAERLWIGSNVYGAGTRTRLAATRYGNVIGSRGSVIPVFRAQALRGELTITDRRCTRFWMRIADAVALVELALLSARGGEVFIPKAGSCGILAVAEAVAPGIPWREIGLRRGEKLHELLVSEDESRDCHDCGTHYLIEPERTWEYLPLLNAPRVLDGWSYRSDTNERQMSVEEMRTLIGPGQGKAAA